MKYKLIFASDDQDEIKHQMAAMDYYCSLVEIEQMLRSIYKHSEAQEERDVENIRNLFYKILESREVILND